jgi:hypothetical protein
LGKLKDRTVSITAVPESALLVNGVTFTASPVAVVNDRAADGSVIDVRRILYNVHFRPGEGGEVSNYYLRKGNGTMSYGKDADAFESDLRTLARIGYEMFGWLFGTNKQIMFTLADLIRNEAKSRDRPAVLQVLDGQHGERAIPWGLVYDLPFGGNSYELCPSIAEFGPRANIARPIPPHCPYSDQHRGKEVLCPFGFWGLSCLVEQPPSPSDRDLELVISSTSDPPRFLVTVDNSLDRSLTEEHLESLKASLGDYITSRPVANADQLGKALGPEEMDLVYCYCHCGYGTIDPSTPDRRYLQFGTAQIFPPQITAWAQTVWPDPHWPHRHPLVVLNGCHSIEATSGSLSSFVPVFTGIAGASGVVGTEVTLEQGLGGWAMGLFLGGLVGQKPVGAALRQMRWTMLRYGNLMGLAYTPYCLVNLSVR